MDATERRRVAAESIERVAFDARSDGCRGARDAQHERRISGWVGRGLEHDVAALEHDAACQTMIRHLLRLAET